MPRRKKFRRNFNREYGIELMNKYLSAPELKTRLDHSQGVGDLAYRIAHKIKQKKGDEIGLDPELVGFLGYAHDIGYSRDAGKHEVHSLNLLLEEGVPEEIARKVMHGQLAEQFGEQEGNVEQYLPVGLEGRILTYADMSFRTGEPIPMDERAQEIVSRVRGIPKMPEKLKKEIESNLYKALPRFKQYETEIHGLAGVSSAKEF